MSFYNLTYSEDQLNVLLEKLNNTSSTLTDSSGFSFVEASPIHDAFIDLTTSEFSDETLHDSDSTGTALSGSLTGSDDTKIATSKLIEDKSTLKITFNIPDPRDVLGNTVDDRYLEFTYNHSFNRVLTRGQWFYECHTAVPEFNIDAGDIVQPMIPFDGSYFIFTDTTITLTGYDNTAVVLDVPGEENVYNHTVLLYSSTLGKNDFFTPTSTNFNLVIYATF